MSAVHAPDTALSKPSRPSCCTKYQKSRVVKRLDRPTQRTPKSTSATARGPAEAPKVTRASAFGSVEHTVRTVSLAAPAGGAVLRTRVGGERESGRWAGLVRSRAS